jgi:hypothetical protein
MTENVSWHVESERTHPLKCKREKNELEERCNLLSRPQVWKEWMYAVGEQYASGFSSSSGWRRLNNIGCDSSEE